MTAATLFLIFNLFALIGWMIMIAGVFFPRPFLTIKITQNWLPILFSASYGALIVFFYDQAEGGFGTLGDVQKLFSDPWIMLAGWLHYLAFDMFVGTYIARHTLELGLARWPLVILLPLTFLFGPIGYLAFETWKMSTRGTLK